VKKFYFTFISLALLSTHFFCTKIDTTNLGVGLLPIVDNINTFDTLLNVETDLVELTDSTRVVFNSNHALGALNDGVFGSTQASIHFSVSPLAGYSIHPFRNKDSVDDANIDSVVLQMAYTNTYGDTSSVLGFDVREVKTGTPNKFKDSLLGYTIKTPLSFFGTGGPLLGTISQKINELNDSRRILNKIGDTTTVSNVLRIKLDNSFGRRLKNYDSTGAANFAYKNDSSFREQLQGLSVVCTSNPAINNGAITYFNLQDPNTRLIVYYRYKRGNSSLFDTLQASYTCQSLARANLLKRNNQFNYAAALASAATNEPTLYLQSSPGSHAVVKIPDLSSLTNRVVHRAELIVERLPDPSVNTQDYPFDTPPILFLDAIDSANNNRPICIPYDFIPAQNSSIGYEIVTFGGDERNKGYRFNLSRYVQSIVTRKEQSYTLRLHAPYVASCIFRSSLGNVPLFFPTSNFIGAGRVLVGGGSNPDPAKKMRLRIIYSKI
jgi:hypothetical protein